ncbi:MAG TPA: sugar ABC transporter ATP-binding protein [Chryseolinea sp.]
MISLHLQNITKRFPGVKALDDVTISIAGGEIHCICGENGAGKSTLMSILSGSLQPDAGNIIIDDAPAKLDNPQAAFDKGISIVYQHLSLFDSLSVAENIYANQHPVGKFGVIQFDDLFKRTKDLLQRLGLETISPTTLVSKLSPAQKQMVEIAKALAKQPSVFILDEPTASLTHTETEILFKILRTQRDKGVAIIYISHRLEEIFLLADRISILKDGKHQGTFPAAALTRDLLIRKMVGRDLKTVRTNATRKDEVLLELRNVTGYRFANISFRLFRGEILGIAGLVGAGRTEVAKAIFGAGKIVSGEIVLRGVNFDPRHPANAIIAGIAYVSEDRKTSGLFPEMSLQDNVVAAGIDSIMPNGIYDVARAREMAAASKEKLRISAQSLLQPVGKLSGGNQQKVMLAKWLLTEPDILIVDEPTHGVDIGAKYEIYEILKSLASEGKGVLMISSELPELIGLCDRILVMKRGIIAGELSGEDKTEEKIMTLAT